MAVANQQELQTAVRYWSDFISKCISQRLDTDQFRDYVRLVHAKYPLRPVAIADFILRPQPSNNVSLDPRIPPYIQVLSQLGYIDAPSILRALYKHSALHAATPGDGKDGDKAKARWKSSSWAEEIMFYHVIKTVVEGSGFKDALGALELVDVICKWMHLFVAASNATALDALQAREEMEIARAAFVPLLLRVVDNVYLLKVLAQPTSKALRKLLSDSLASFIQILQPVPQFAEKLEVFRTETLAQMDPIDKKSSAAANAAMDELLDSTVGSENFVIPEIAISTTRTGLFVYLSASLIGRPILDDHTLFSYLNNRHQGNTQASAIDLILASFDVLASAAWKKPNSKDGNLLRSYLVNKVPLLLCQLVPPEFSTTTSEFCITEALNQLDNNVFPTASLMFDSIQESNQHTDSVREEFCSACALHGLIDRGHVDRILGELSMAYNPNLQKQSKETLVQECLTDPSKIQGLLLELEKMDGNVGAVCQALVELIRQLCNNKETMTLKLLCSQLAQKPQSLDILLLFEKLPAIMTPLCQLLDGWKYDDDQTEYQPVYDEFGSILLLVLAFAYRYKVSSTTLGAPSNDSAIARIINKSHASRSLDDLSEQEKNHVNGWIQGLFDSDAGGLGDDLMSSCPPGDFYQLIGTIFQSIVTAHAHGYVNEETLKGGFEYLADTFLLPCLAPAMLFLADYLWVDQKEQKSIIKILHMAMTPSSNQEANIMLISVKNLIAQPLTHALRTYQREDPRNQEVEPLIESLRENVPLSRRTGCAENTELEKWANASSTGLTGALRQTMQSLIQWSLQSGTSSPPPDYTHRKLVAGVKIIGARRLLRLIVDEVRQQTDAGHAGAAYDLAVALIAAPDVTAGPTSASSPLDLRGALKAEADDWKITQKKDAQRAEIIVRLHRKVEAQLLIPPPEPILQDAEMTLIAADATQLDDAITAAVDDTMAVDASVLDASALDATALDLALEPVTEGDLFDLEGTIDVFDGWDSMDLGGGDL